MPILYLITMLLALAVLAGIRSMALPIREASWIIGPFGRGKLPDWTVSGSIYVTPSENTLILDPTLNQADSVTLTYDINRDWSGYQALEIKLTGASGHRIKINLIGPDGACWSAASAITGETQVISFPFDSFQLEEGSSDFLDLALLKSAQIELRNPEHKTSPVAIESIMLSGSKGLYGPGVYIDIVFEYYRTKPWPQIVREARDKAFTSIHLVDVDLQPEGFDELSRKVDVVHEGGLSASLTIYPSTDHIAYERHPEWRQRSVGGFSRYDWRTYLCPNNKEFTNYLINKVTQAVTACKFDALELAEPWFEIWGGPEDPAVGAYYSCICPHCQQKFQAISGIDPAELFKPDGEHYFRHNLDLYEQWIQFRVDTLNQFMIDIFSAAKKVRPEILAIPMQLSDCLLEPGKAREYQGQDFDSIISLVKPDSVILESAWQDWMDAGLEPTYIYDYAKAYVPRQKNTPLISQCDIGSYKEVKRGIEWLRHLSSINNRAGFFGYIAYEYSLGLDTSD